MIYKHFKGAFYLKLFTARNCDDSTQVYVVYIALYSTVFKFGQPWIRPELQFNDVHPKHWVKRMRKLTFWEHVLLLTGNKKYIK